VSEVKVEVVVVDHKQQLVIDHKQPVIIDVVILAKEDHKVQEYQQEGDSYKRKVFLSRCTFIKLLLRTTCKNRIYGIFYYIYIYNKYIN
jgi:hypothetical protein